MMAEELLREYRRCILRRSATDDPEQANQAHDELLATVRAIRDFGIGRSILSLLYDPSEHVRLRAGFDALWLAREDGIRVLRDLADNFQGEVGLDASTCLSLLETGELILYPWEQDDEATT